MKQFSKSSTLLIFLMAIGLASCNNDDDSKKQLTIYEKLGGFKKVVDPTNPNAMIEQGRLAFRSVVDSTIVLIVTDIAQESNGNLGEYFAPILAEVSSGNTSNVAVLSKDLTDFFSANTGGGKTNTYNGLDMVSAHNPAQNPRMGAKADNGDFNQFIGYVGTAATLNGVTDPSLLSEIVQVLESLRTQVVQDL